MNSSEIELKRSKGLDPKYFLSASNIKKYKNDHGKREREREMAQNRPLDAKKFPDIK